VKVATLHRSRGRSKSLDFREIYKGRKRKKKRKEEDSREK